MEQTIEEIMQFIRKRTGEYGWLDQSSIYNELARRIEEENSVCLKMEYGMTMDDDDEE